MIIALNILSILLFCYFAFSVIYQLLLALLSHLPVRPLQPKQEKLHKMAVFIPAYKEDGVIVEVAKDALHQAYPESHYDVIVIADSMQPHTLDKLGQLPIKLIVVSFEKSTKSKALRKAMSQLTDGYYDIAVILDADNLMEKGFLERINLNFNAGYKAVQGQRKAKNYDSPMAILDGASEGINNNIVCKGPQKLNLSARLAGSGMAFDYALFKEVMNTVEAIGGFDKELELKLASRKHFIAYDEKAAVLDEKIRSNKHFSRQRSRWIAAQYFYLRKFLRPATKALLTKGNRDFFNKTIQLTLPPRLILPGVLFIGSVLSWLLSSEYFIIWLLLFLGNVATFIIALPKVYWSRKFIMAIPHLILAFGGALLALTKLGKANKTFIHTPHGAPTKK